MTEEEICQAMQALEFCKDWQTLGWLDIEHLEVLYAEYQQGEDTNTEHYRYAMFRHWFQQHKTLTDEQVEVCFTLSRADPDQGMIPGVIDILREHLSAQQFQNNILSIYELGPYIRKRDLEAQLYQEINNGMTEDLFQRCLSSQSQNIYAAIARDSNIPLIYLEHLDTFLQLYGRFHNSGTFTR
jgi:hypothetical protein